ncbi:MAG: polymer-forming cytoskeletal protein [bacterium]
MKEPRATITNIIGVGTIVNGRLKVEGSIRVDGTVEGNLDVTEAIIIGKTGKVRGDIHAKEFMLAGSIDGNIFIGGRAEFGTGSRLKGDIKCKQLIIEEGVMFDGNCSMSDREMQAKPQFFKGQRERSTAGAIDLD